MRSCCIMYLYFCLCFTAIICTVTLSFLSTSTGLDDTWSCTCLYRSLQVLTDTEVYPDQEKACRETWPRGYKTFFKLSSAEHEISTPYKGLANLLLCAKLISIN